MNDPRQTLDAIAELAQAASVGWPAYQATAAALASSTIGGGGGDGRRGSDVPDPTHNIVVSLERYNECEAQLSEALGIMRDVQRRMASVRRQDPATARLVDSAIAAARCSGEVDPLCTNNSVRDTGENAGLCWKCIKRKQREAAAADEAQAS